MRVLNSASDSGTKVLIVLLFFTFCPRNCQGSFPLDDDRLPVVALDEGRLLGYLLPVVALDEGRLLGYLLPVVALDEGRLLGYLPPVVALDEGRLLGYLPGDDRLPLVEIAVRCDDAMLTSGRVAASNGLDDERLLVCVRVRVCACVSVGCVHHGCVHDVQCV
jgi:hypothetical protein